MLYKLLIFISIEFHLACEGLYVLVDIWITVMLTHHESLPNTWGVKSWPGKEDKNTELACESLSLSIHANCQKSIC
jgi:hypothetical protein